VGRSLRHSCTSTIIRQGISLPLNRQDYSCRLPGLWNYSANYNFSIFRHRTEVSPYTSSYDLAETCVFVKQSPPPILLHPKGHSFFRSYGVNLPSSFRTISPLALVYSTCPPVLVYGTVICACKVSRFRSPNRKKQYNVFLTSGLSLNRFLKVISRKLIT